MRALVAACALAAVAAGAPATVRAQVPAAPPAAPELRLDLITGRHAAVQGGVGIQIPAGYYVRVGVDAAAGVALGDSASRGSSDHRLDGRIDVLARFLLDPFRQTAYGLSAGGGVSLRAEPGDHVRPFLLVALEVEGRRSTKGVVPAVQLGLGGGARIGVILRRAAAGAR